MDITACLYCFQRAFGPLSSIVLRLSDEKEAKTYAREYSHVVTDRSTSPPVASLSTRERTGSPVFSGLCTDVIT